MAFEPGVPLLVVGAFLMQFLVQGAWGVVPPHLSELSPDSVRGFLPGFGYQCGVLLASSATCIEAVFAHRTSYAIAMAGTAATVFLLAAATTAMGPGAAGGEVRSVKRHSPLPRAGIARCQPTCDTGQDGGAPQAP